jgi:hypothetical protein
MQYQPSEFSFPPGAGESQLSGHVDGAALAALEMTGAKALARGRLIGGAQYALRRVTAFIPDQLISRGLAATMLREEPRGPEPVVLLYRAQHVTTGYVCAQPASESVIGPPRIM